MGKQSFWRVPAGDQVICLPNMANRWNYDHWSLHKRGLSKPLARLKLVFLVPCGELVSRLLTLNPNWVGIGYSPRLAMENTILVQTISLLNKALAVERWIPVGVGNLLEGIVR